MIALYNIIPNDHFDHHPRPGNQRIHEVLLFPDEASKEHFPRTRIIPRGTVGPARKRDLALKVAKGTLFAFSTTMRIPTEIGSKRPCGTSKTRRSPLSGGLR
jgi:hypothetical protein